VARKLEVMVVKPSLGILVAALMVETSSALRPKRLFAIGRFLRAAAFEDERVNGLLGSFCGLYIKHVHTNNSSLYRLQ
jgi:hypothetical protein